MSLVALSSQSPDGALYPVNARAMDDEYMVLDIFAAIPKASLWEGITPSDFFEFSYNGINYEAVLHARGLKIERADGRLVRLVKMNLDQPPHYRDRAEHGLGHRIDLEVREAVGPGGVPMYCTILPVVIRTAEPVMVGEDLRVTVQRRLSRSFLGVRSPTRTEVIRVQPYLPRRTPERDMARPISTN